MGRHAAQNIALAAEVAYSLGMTPGEIASAIKDLEFIEHRLQLIKAGGVNILDDGYNSNVKGAAAALEVLKSFNGRKIAVTPGLKEGYLSAGGDGAKLILKPTLAAAQEELKGYLADGDTVLFLNDLPDIY